MRPPGATQPLGALQGNKCHWQNQVYLSSFYYLSQAEGGLVLIQPPGSHPTEIRRQLVQVLILHPGSQDLGCHPSSHLSCLWMWPNLSFPTQSQRCSSSLAQLSWARTVSYKTSRFLNFSSTWRKTAWLKLEDKTRAMENQAVSIYLNQIQQSLQQFSNIQLLLQQKQM